MWSVHALHACLQVSMSWVRMPVDPIDSAQLLTCACLRDVWVYSKLLKMFVKRGFSIELRLDDRRALLDGGRGCDLRGRWGRQHQRRRPEEDLRTVHCSVRCSGCSWWSPLAIKRPLMSVALPPERKATSLALMHEKLIANTEIVVKCV